MKQNIVKLLVGCCCVMTLVGCGNKTATHTNNTNNQAPKLEITQTQQNNEKTTNSGNTSGKTTNPGKASGKATNPGKTNRKEVEKTIEKEAATGKTNSEDKSGNTKDTGKR